MWESKVFKTEKAMFAFIKKLGDTYQWTEIFIANGYCIEYKKKITIDFD